MLLIFLFITAFNQGVVIVDNVWFYEGDLKSRAINTGDIVEIIGKIDGMTRIKIDNVVGKLTSGVLIDFDEEIAAEKLLIFARGYYDEGEYDKARKLFRIFIENFAWSEYLAEALYYYGMASEAIAGHTGDADTTSEFHFNERYNIWHYSGAAYMRILEDFPDSYFAAGASYRLLHILRMNNLPWNDSILLINDELRMWQDFTTQYQDSEEYVLGLLELGYLHRVLFELSGDTGHKEQAQNIFQQIMQDHPNTVSAAQAKVHLYEIEKGENIYKY